MKKNPKYLVLMFVILVLYFGAIIEIFLSTGESLIDNPTFDFISFVVIGVIISICWSKYKGKPVWWK